MSSKPASIIPAFPSIYLGHVTGSSSTSAEASKELRSYTRSSIGFTYFHLLPLRTMNFDVLALLLMAPIRFHVIPQSYMPFFCLPWRKENRLKLARKETYWILPRKEANGRLRRKQAKAAVPLEHRKPQMSCIGFHYWHSCVCVRAFPQASMKYVVLRLINMQT